MNLELRLLRSLTTRLPGIPGAGLLANSLSQFYNRKPRVVVECESGGWNLRLDPAEAVERGMLFFPQLYERREREFLRQHLRPGDVFLDIGANVGFYTLVTSKLVGPSGRVIAFEADSDTHKCLTHHIAVNGAHNALCLNVGVSDRNETLYLSRNRSGNRGGNTFLNPNPDSIAVTCAPLVELLGRQGVTRVDAAKIDIEGMEVRVMTHFLNHAPESMWPRFLVIEDNPEFSDQGVPLTKLMQAHGYRVIAKTDLNLLLDRPCSAEHS